MDDRRIWVTGVGCALALLAPRAVAGSDQMQATVNKPAVVTATAPANVTDQSRVVFRVTGYLPAEGGSAEAVVKAEKKDGTEQEIGRFTVIPQAPFKSDPAGAQRYSVPLPKDLAGEGSVKLKVELVPGPKANGAGARLELGGAEISGGAEIK